MSTKKTRRLRLPRLSRPWRLARNLLLLALTLFLFWCSPAVERVFPAVGYRRLERQYLLEDSKLLLSLSREGHGIWYVGMNDEDFLLASGHSGRLVQMRFVPRSERTQLIPIYRASLDGTTFQIFCWDGGAGPDSGTLTLRLQSETLGFDETYTASAARQGSGCFVFAPQTHYYDGWNADEGPCYSEYAALLSYLGQQRTYLDGKLVEVTDLVVTGTLTYS